MPYVTDWILQRVLKLIFRVFELNRTGMNPDIFSPRHFVDRVESVKNRG
jgi:hypothetical protein